ncbi:hypothetical protein [Collimonas fungivorans]|uniref:hypothetical protein n=1 Tax=Collimonas fungivorans TaxID=158899 RepID=UPI0026EDD77A|nr:hypothetical protein [Collimonas fungivorans]
MNDKTPHKKDGEPLLPNERDETPDQQAARPRKKMKQALTDLDKGLVDTDMHGQRGVEKVVRRSTKLQGK